MTEQAVHVENLSKSYGKIPAISDVSFSIREGELFGLIGPDGAGKTTTMRILCGLLSFNSGQCKVLSHDVQSQIKEIKKIIGYMSQKFSLYNDLTVEENINFYGGIYVLSSNSLKQRKEWILEKLSLIDQRKAITGEIPLGWKQRLALGCTFLHNPPILFWMNRLLALIRSQGGNFGY